MTPIEVTLLALNLACLVACAAALIRLKARSVDRTDEGRALMVTLTAVLVMTLAGLARRVDHAAADHAVAAAWVAVLAAAVWAATHTRPDRDT